MLKFRDNLAKLPPGGWHYPEDETTFRGESPKEVVRAMREYRIRSGKPIGEPMNDLILYCARRWPHLVTEDFQEGEEAIPGEKPLQFLQAWLVIQSRVSALGAMDEDRIQWQAEICRNCPMNRDIPQEPADLAIEVARRSFLLRRGREIPGVGYCGHHLWDNRVACARNSPVMGARPNPPENCWVNKGPLDHVTSAVG